MIAVGSIHSYPFNHKNSTLTTPKLKNYLLKMFSEKNCIVHQVLQQIWKNSPRFLISKSSFFIDFPENGKIYFRAKIRCSLGFWPRGSPELTFLAVALEY